VKFLTASVISRIIIFERINSIRSLWSWISSRNQYSATVTNVHD